MRDAFALSALAAGIAGVGFAAVWAAGVPVRGGWRWTAIGLAPLTGLAVLGSVSVLAVVVGVGARVWVVFPASVLLIAVAARFRERLVAWPPRPPSPHRGAVAGEIVVLAAMGFVAIRAIRTYLATPLEAWDGWAIWGAHAQALFLSNSLFIPSFRDPVYGSQHPEYPVAFPSLEALSAHALGRFDTKLVHVVPAVFLVALGLAAWGILRTLVPPVIAAGAALFVMGSGAEIGNLRDNYADGALAALIAIGVLLVAVWATHESTSALALATVLLAAAGLTKAEGALFAAAAVLAATVVCRLDGRRLRPLLVSGSFAVAVPLVWQAFARVVVPPDSSYDWSVLVHPGGLSDRAGRYSQALRALLDALILNWRAAVLVVLLSLMLAGLAGRWRLATYLILWVALSQAGLGVSYLASTENIDWHLSTSAHRVVITLAVSASLLAAWVAVDAWDNRIGRPVRIAPDTDGPATADPA